MINLRLVSRRELSDEISRAKFSDHEAKNLMVGLVPERVFIDVIYRQSRDGPVYKAKHSFSVEEMIDLAERVYKVREKVKGSIPEDQKEKLRLDVEKRYCAFFRVIPVPNKDANHDCVNPFKFEDSLERMMQWSELKEELTDATLDSYDSLALVKLYVKPDDFMKYVNDKSQRFSLKDLVGVVKDEYQRKYHKLMLRYEVDKVRRSFVSRYCDMYHVLLLDPESIGENNSMSDRVRQVLNPNNSGRISVAEQIKGSQLGLFK